MGAMRATSLNAAYSSEECGYCILGIPTDSNAPCVISFLKKQRVALSFRRVLAHSVSERPKSAEEVCVCARKRKQLTLAKHTSVPSRVGAGNHQRAHRGPARTMPPHVSSATSSVQRQGTQHPPARGFHAFRQTVWHRAACVRGRPRVPITCKYALSCAWLQRRIKPTPYSVVAPRPRALRGGLASPCPVLHQARTNRERLQARPESAP